jgi:hypothetical protein
VTVVAKVLAGRPFAGVRLGGGRAALALTLPRTQDGNGAPVSVPFAIRQALLT